MAASPGPLDIIEMRASALGELFDDALRWKTRILDKIHTPTYGRSHLGSAIHYGTALYDVERAEGRVPSAEAAADAFVQFLRADEYVHWVDIGRAEAESIGVQLVNLYCTEISHRFDWIKVEAECTPLEITMPNGIMFKIIGHVDRVYAKRVGRKDRFGVADLKSGYGVIKADGSLDVAKHGAQLAVYELLELAAQELTGEEVTLPAVIIGFSTSGEPRIEYEEVENPRTLLFGDGENMGYLFAASKIIEHELWIGNPRSNLCSAKYCGIYETCFYRRGITNGS